MSFSSPVHKPRIALWLALLGIAACRAEPGREHAQFKETSDDSGSVCVEKLPATRPLEEYYGTKPRPGPKSEFWIILDDADTVSITRGMGGSFGKLKYTGRHRIRILLDGKPREDFTFDFEERASSRLCLFYRKPYGTWSLEPAAWRKRTCTCLNEFSDSLRTPNKNPGEDNPTRR